MLSTSIRSQPHHLCQVGTLMSTQSLTILDLSAFAMASLPRMATIRVNLEHPCRTGQLTCQPGLFLVSPEVPYLPFDAARDGYPSFDPTT